MTAGGVSETARRVAAQRLTFERVATDYGDARSEEALARDVAGDAPRTGPLTRYLEVRTRFFDRVVVGSLGRGIGQVVVGAAGYDGRSLRYAKPGVAWFEVDLPATQSDKRRRLDALGIDSSHVRFVAADFRTDDIRGALTPAGFDDTRPALFLLEGVAVYLDEGTLRSVLSQFSSLAAPGSVLAVSLSVSGGSPLHALRRAAFRTAVAALGEPARSSVPPEEVDALLSSTGWSRAPGGGDQASGRADAAGFVLARKPVP